MTLSLIIVLAAELATTPAVMEPDPKAMSYQEIRAFNATVDRSHPFYIRCVKSEKIGSLVKRDVSCRTNAQWKKAHEIGNQEARDVLDHMKGKATNSN